MTKTVMKLLEENRQALKSLDNSLKTDETVKSIIERLLSQPKYKDKRARNLDLDDFLELLSDFHEEGIHFTS
jgi:16S rRNA A1518/A1519 N6-dimethyltransferase RsmA/KsgA/DIM1 with predicted DNA glycosylase/AP lyase activity